MRDVNKRFDELCEQYGIKPSESPRREPPPSMPEPLKAAIVVPKADGDWERSIDFVLRWEGGYSDHPNDGGGETNRGITASALKRAYSQGIVKHCDIRALTRDEAKIIYKANYWLSYGWNELPWPVCLCLFDATANHGGGGMARILQRALVARGHSVAVDGCYGPATKAALKKATANLLKLAQAICDSRRDFYERIIESNPSQAVFKKGWFNRLRELARTAGVKSPV